MMARAGLRGIDSRSLAVKCGITFAVVGALIATPSLKRLIRRWTLRPRLALLNPIIPTSRYSVQACQMLEELFAAIGCQVALHEFDVAKEPFDYATLADRYDGFIIPGSMASAYDDPATYPWIPTLTATIRQLHERRRPVLGICFGHQIISQALGGRVEKNPKGLGAAKCLFDVLPLGANLGLAEAPGKNVGALQYHHNDIVTRLPNCAANLACSATCPAHASAVFPTAAEARMAVQRGAAPSKPHAITLQGHPEFSTPTGAEVLADILRHVDGPKFGEGWLAERLPTVDDAATTERAHSITRAAMKLLWPVAFDHEASS